MPCQKHCLDCAADAQGYYNLQHYLRVHGGTVEDFYELSQGEVTLYKGHTNAPAKHYPYPSPYEASRALPAGDSDRVKESWTTSTGATVTPLGVKLNPGERVYTYDKMEWIAFWLGVAAKALGVSIVLFVGWKIIQAIMWLGDWVGIHSAAIVSTISGVMLLFLIGIVAFALSKLGGGGGPDFSFKGTGKFL